MLPPEFKGFPKIARFSRGVVVTEKIDGTNAQIYVNEDATDLVAGSRKRWITPQDDNYGFAGWVEANKADLLKLGPGTHFGEWWGLGIQRRYGLTEKRFSLFNTMRWNQAAPRPSCCGVVPILWTGGMEELNTVAIMAKLAAEGSVAAPGFMNPEGIVIYHQASGTMLKRTLDRDEQPKSVSASE